MKQWKIIYNIITAVYLFLVFLQKKISRMRDREKQIAPDHFHALYPHEPYMYLKTNEHAVIVYNNTD